MIYGSVCSGIESATVAWHPLGWTPAFFAEIEKFPKAVLAHHYPSTPDLGDFTKIGAVVGPIDLLVGGTPCQSFSVAGLRKGLDDPRGNLMLEFGSLARRLRPRWLVWENVPGVLSSNGGRDFGTFLGMLGELGFGFAYAVLDAQFFGVAQRRRRVFVVGHAGGLWQRAAAVLFEPESLRGDPAPRREAGQRPSGSTEAVAGVADTLQTTCGDYSRSDGFLAIPTIARSLNASPTSGGSPNEDSNLIALGVDTYNHALTGDVSATISNKVSMGHGMGVLQGEVRRLTPRECERLQGFPDDYTAIPGAVDGHRYRALGNSMAVPVVAWIGRRIAAVDAACQDASQEVA